MKFEPENSSIYLNLGVAGPVMESASTRSLSRIWLFLFKRHCYTTEMTILACLVRLNRFDLDEIIKRFQLDARVFDPPKIASRARGFRRNPGSSHAGRSPFLISATRNSEPIMSCYHEVVKLNQTSIKSQPK